MTLPAGSRPGRYQVLGQIGAEGMGEVFTSVLRPIGSSGDLMALSAGGRLCPYEILAPIGAGGTAELLRNRLVGSSGHRMT